MRQVAALFVRADSVYKSMPGVDCYDIERDARTWPGGVPGVFHPPCTRWSMINGVVLSRYPHKADEFAWGNDDGAFAWALDAVRRNGGALEHPGGSRAWAHHHMPRIGRGPDRFGGWSCEVRQCDWGHKAEKLTWLYIVGVHPDDLPALPARSEPTGVIKPQRDVPRDGRKIVTKAEREHTPPELAAWLVELARRTRVAERLAA